MKFTDRLHELTGQIIDDPALDAEQKEKRIVQAFDLCHFIHCYNSSLKVLDYIYHDINIVEDNGRRKGIYFWDLIHNRRYHHSAKALCQSYVAAFKARFNLAELWFVIVEESFFSTDITESADFVKNNKVRPLYDRILYFNYTHSTIENLI